MSRASAVAVREELEDLHSPHALLAFLTIRHPNLADPIRVVSDVLDYIKGGETFIGLPFGYRLLTDGESAPRTELRMQNADRRIGQALLSLTGRAVLELQICSSADFDLSVSPRTEIGSAAAIYAFRHFSLANVTATATDLTGEVILQDYSVEPWPAVRATEDRLPGLYR